MFGSLFTAVCALEVQLQKHGKERPIIALKDSGGEKAVHDSGLKHDGVAVRKAPIVVQ